MGVSTKHYSLIVVMGVVYFPKTVSANNSLRIPLWIAGMTPAYMNMVYILPLLKLDRSQS
jgi:hypothetical protein